jgi:hypothetical protein
MVTRLAVLALAVVLTSLLATLTARTQAQPLTGSAQDFERAQFDDPTHIDNRWLPLKPGTQLVLEGSAIVDEGGRQPRRVVTTVTDLTKVIDGVKTLVIWERDFTSGKLSEPELAFFAQDNAGNVWLVGEYPEEYEDGKFDKAPAWISGQKGARAGVSMKAEPRQGVPDYAQGYAPPPVDFDDRAKVYRTDQQTCVPVDCYENVLVTEEFNPSEPGAFQLKYYASGVGNVRVGWRGEKEEEKETLELVALNHLSPEAMRKVRREAMEMDRRAYKRSEVYRETPPAKHTLRVRPAVLAQETTTLTTTATPGLPPTGGLSSGGFALLGAALLLGAGILSAAVLRRRS